MQVNRSDFEEFLNAAVAGLFDALSFASDGDATALQSVFTEVASYFAANFTDVEDIDSWVGELSNAVNFSSLLGMEEQTEESVRRWLATALSFDDELTNIAMEVYRMEEENVMAHQGQKSQETAPEAVPVETEVVTEPIESVDTGDSEQVDTEPTDIPEEQKEDSSDNSEEQMELSFTYGEFLSGMKSQLTEVQDSMNATNLAVMERLERLESYFTITMPQKGSKPKGNGQKSQSKQRNSSGTTGYPADESQKTIRHELKFGNHFNGGGNGDTVDESAAERMLKYANMDK